VRARGAAGGSDTSPIIALAHIRRLELVKTLYGSVLIPPSVKTEWIDRGRAIGARDVYEIEKRLQQGWITVVPLGKNSEREATQLDGPCAYRPGRSGGYHACEGEGRAPVILDDAEARAVARSLDLEYMGTLMLPYQAFRRKILSREELVEILTSLSRVLWVSPDVIAEILRRAEG